MLYSTSSRSTAFPVCLTVTLTPVTPTSPSGGEITQNETDLTCTVLSYRYIVLHCIQSSGGERSDAVVAVQHRAKIIITALLYITSRPLLNNNESGPTTVLEVTAVGFEFDM